MAESVVEPVVTPVTEPVATPPVTETKNVVDKAVFDKTASELAEVKKQLKARKTADELTQDEALAKETELVTLKAEVENQKLLASQGLALGLTAEVKTIADVKEGDVEFTAFVYAISSTNKENTTKLASYFSKVVKSAYDKGVADTTNGTIKTLADNVNVGGNDKNTKSAFAQYQANTPQKTDYVDLNKFQTDIIK